MAVENFEEARRRVALRLFNRGGGVLPGFKAPIKRAALERAHKIALWLERRADVVKNEAGESCECFNCSWGNSGKYARHSFTAEVFETPWDNEPKQKLFCSDECRELYLYDGDFSYRTCDSCGREICQQNPANGWQWQFRELNDFEEVCLCCYEQMILENGCDREKFAKGQLPGMFFSWGNPELEEAGYLPVPGYQNKFVRGSGSEACTVALDLIDRGGKVICAYEAMGIGGGEGFISLYVKGVNLETWRAAV